MDSEKVSSKQAVYTCLVCGDTARGMNFDVITCMSCKAFFRRNALRKNKEYICHFENNCEIDQRTRSLCSACRLKKCFHLGMNAKLIRTSYDKNHQRSTKKNKDIVQTTTVSCLNTDRLILTFDEWNLLSCILQAYDQQNSISKIQSILQEQLSLHPKIRLKFSNTFDLVSTFYQFIHPFLQHIPQFRNLSIDLRRLLIQKNFSGIGTWNSIYLAYQTKAFQNKNCLTTCTQIYGNHLIKETRRLISRLDSNDVLIKIMLVILAFSTNCSIVRFDSTLLNSTISSSTMNSIVIQDSFIILLWKYLVYQYGYLEAVRRLNNLVKYYLDILNGINEIENQRHDQMINMTIEKIVKSLDVEK